MENEERNLQSKAQTKNTIWKYAALILFEIIGYFISSAIFSLILAPLYIGPRPVVAAVTAVMVIFIFAIIAIKLFKIKLN